MRLRFTVTAHAKLNALWAHLFEVNRFAAKRMREQVARSLGRLRTFPRMGAQVAEFPAVPIRQIIVEPYRFFYYIDERTKTVWLVDVWHGAQIPRLPCPAAAQRAALIAGRLRPTLPEYSAIGAISAGSAQQARPLSRQPS